MRILVTNDDGIDAPGIHALAGALAAHTTHEIVVVAPDRDHSGASASLAGFGTRIARQTVTLPDPHGDLEAYAIDGPPALTVVAACLEAFGPRPDLVVSGINAGLNTGRSIMFSGTVGAALTAQAFGLSGLAVSVQAPDEREDPDAWRWDTAAAIAVEVLPRLIDGPDRSVLNLNVPSLPHTDVRGIRWARLASFGEVRTAVTGHGDDHLLVELQATGLEPDEDTDTGTVRAGFASLTTLVGLAEAWPTPQSGEPPTSPTIVEAVVPGAPLHPVHRVPDAEAHGALRRPVLGID